MKLHLGCGKRFIPGFIHIDKSYYDHIDHFTDVSDLRIIKNGSCSLIYASHVLEYFDFQEARAVLIEWFNKLEKGGILRISLPDFNALIKVYDLTNNNIDKIIGPLFGRIEIEDVTLGELKTVYHKTVFNEKKLLNLLKECGFVDIRKYDWKTTIHKDYDDHSQAYYPHMDKENGLQISLNIEAIK